MINATFEAEREREKKIEQKNAYRVTFFARVASSKTLSQNHNSNFDSIITTWVE